MGIHSVLLLEPRGRAVRGERRTGQAFPIDKGDVQHRGSVEDLVDGLLVVRGAVLVPAREREIRTR